MAILTTRRGFVNPAPASNTIVSPTTKSDKNVVPLVPVNTFVALAVTLPVRLAVVKVLNGPSATHQTILNGQSADWGFLIGTQVELFLGDGLRYLVRVNGINVNHTIFNDRMVPVLSQVSISCGRYNDVGLPASDARSQE